MAKHLFQREGYGDWIDIGSHSLLFKYRDLTLVDVAETLNQMSEIREGTKIEFEIRDIEQDPAQLDLGYCG